LAHEVRSRLAFHYIETAQEKKGDWGDTNEFPWFEIEMPNIAATMEWADSNGMWGVVILLFENIFFFLGTRGYFHERVRYGRMALASAQNAGDHWAAAMCNNTLGWTFDKLGQYAEAEASFQLSAQSYLDLGEVMQAARIKISLAEVAIAKGEIDRARRMLDEAEDMSGATGYVGTARGLLKTRGRLEFEAGNYAKARALFLRALEEEERVRWGVSIGSRQIDMGNVALAQGQLEEADSWFTAGMESSVQDHRQDGIGNAELGLARVKALLNQETEAIAYATSARSKFARMGMLHSVREADDLLCRLGGK
jgi:tetratricopeptide (TPR) repeat protein